MKITEEYLQELAKDNVKFAREILRFDPYPPQVKVLRACMSGKDVVICAGRQSGKSITLAADCVHYAFFNPEKNVIIVSPSQEQSNLFLRKVKQFIHKNKLLSASVVRETTEIVELSNNTEIRSLPSGQEGYTIRGHTAHRIYIDESAHIKSRIVTDVIYPMGAHTGATIIQASTPAGRNHFWDAWNDPNVIKIHFSTEEIAKYNRSTAKYLEKIRARTPPQKYAREYLAKFVSESNVVFSHSVLENAIDEKLEQLDSGDPRKTYVAGVDLGKHRSSTVLAIVQLGKPAKLVRLVVYRRAAYKQIARLIKAWTKRFNIIKVCVDQTGVGEAFVEDLMEKLECPVEGVKFTHQQKEKLIENLLAMLETGKLKLYYDRDLYDELYSYTFKITPSGIKYQGAQDDRVDALALAAWAAKHKHTVSPFIVGVEW